MSYELTQHARDVLDEREIRVEWVEHVLITPDLTEPAESDLASENRFGKIAEFEECKNQSRPTRGFNRRDES